MLEGLETAIKLEVIRDLADLPAKFYEEWSCLHAAILHSTPFQSPEWLLTWWKYFGSGQPRIFCFRDDDNCLVGLIACFLHDWNGRRQLTLLGSGVSDYLEPLVAPAHRVSIVQQLASYLESSESWDLCDWQDLSADSALLSLRNSRALCVYTEPDLPCSQIPLSDSFAQFWNARPSGLRRNVKRYRQKAEEIAPVVFEHTPACDPTYLDALIRLHSARWREQGEPGMISANRSGQFLRDVCRLLAEKQELLFFGLKFQGEIAAVILGFPHRNEIYAYLSAFDPAYGAFGLGRTLLFESIRYASNHGYTSWNFLRGEESYKADWGGQPIRKLRVCVTRSSDANSQVTGRARNT